MPPHLLDVWPFYRVVTEKHDTHSGADQMTIDEIDDLLMAVDAVAAAQPKAPGKVGR